MHALQSLQPRRPHDPILESLRDAVNFAVAINFLRKAVTRNSFSKRKAPSKYPKIIILLPAIR